MQTAYNHFNSGKYKEAFNNLTSSNSLNTIDSFEPNLAICEYLSNRCLQASINCHKKLNQWLNKKFKRQNYKLDCQTESIVKLNIAILLILLGKRENSLLVMTDIYKNRGCFIEFMQSRILLLLMVKTMQQDRNQISIQEIALKYQPFTNAIPQRPLLNAHETSHRSGFPLSCMSTVNQEFIFISNIFVNQALMQLGISQQFLISREEDTVRVDELIEKSKKRKINKYYEINVKMIGRFHQAQKQLHAKSYVKCLQLMNFANIQNQYQQMPTTKIITNILNALTTSNVGIVNLALKKPHLSLAYFSKAKTLLSKGCTGVQDKDLQLFSTNYANHSESITYNMALCLLEVKSKQAYNLFQSIRKSNPNVQNYKYWYRIGQSVLQNYHSNIQRLSEQSKEELLEESLECFMSSLNLINKNNFPSESVLNSLIPEFGEQQFQMAQMSYNSQKRAFRKSIIVILCYLYNCLGKYLKTISLATQALKSDINKDDELNILHYLMQAYTALDKQEESSNNFTKLKKQTDSIKDVSVSCIYSDNPLTIEQSNYQDLFIYQTALWFMNSDRNYEAASLVQNLRVKAGQRPSQTLKKMLKYLHIEIGLEKKFMQPYLK